MGQPTKSQERVCECFNGREQEDEDDEVWSNWRVDDLEPESWEQCARAVEVSSSMEMSRRSSSTSPLIPSGRKNHLVGERYVETVLLMVEKHGAENKKGWWNEDRAQRGTAKAPEKNGKQPRRAIKKAPVRWVEKTTILHEAVLSAKKKSHMAHKFNRSRKGIRRCVGNVGGARRAH